MADRHGGSRGGRLAGLVGELHRMKMRAVMGKIRGRSFRTGHKTDGPRGHEMRPASRPEPAESGRHPLRSNAPPSYQGGLKAAHAERCQSGVASHSRSRMHQEMIDGSDK